MKKLTCILLLLVALTVYPQTDPSLQLHLTFDEDFSGGQVTDISGYNRHGLNFGRLAIADGTRYPTNWPYQTNGIRGTGAAAFRQYQDGWDLDEASGRSGDYIGITNLGPLNVMSNGTIAVWAWYYPGLTNIGEVASCALVDGGMNFNGAWHLGRWYSYETRFGIYSNSSVFPEIKFPDKVASTTKGDSGGWHHYAFAFESVGGNLSGNGYYDGIFFTNYVWTNVSALRVPAILEYPVTNRFQWIGIGCRTHNGTAWMEIPEKQPAGTGDFPNGGWMKGAIDDVRIYTRKLSAAEIAGLAERSVIWVPAIPKNLRTTP